MKQCFIKQESQSDCGACCLYSIVKYYNGFVPLEIIKIDTLTNIDGTNFYNLKEAGIKYGFEVIGEKINKLFNGKPYIAQLCISDGIFHFVVIYKVVDNYVFYIDPSCGLKKEKIDDFYNRFTGNILKFNPINKIIVYKKNNYLKKLVIDLYKANCKKIIILFVINIIIILLSIIYTYGIKIAIDKSIKIIILLLGICLSKTILVYIKNTILAHLKKYNNTRLISNYLDHIFFLPLKYLQLISCGEVSTRVNNLYEIKDFFSNEILNFITSIIAIFSISIVIFILNRYIFIYFLSLSIIYITILYIINKNHINLYYKTLDKESCFINHLIEYINKIKTIKNMNKEKFFLNKVLEDNNSTVHSHFILDKYLNLLNVIQSLYIDLSLIGIILLNILIGWDSTNLLIIILYSNYLLENVNYIISLLPIFSYIKSIFAKINSIYYLDKENLDNGVKFVNNDIVLSNISYSYSANTVFKDFSQKVNKGDKVLLIGNNGSGKTTLLNMLNNNIDDYKGEIIINNQNINLISKSSLRSNMYNSSQDDCLFVDTIKNNIVLDKPYDEDKLKKIEKILELNRIIENKSNGYDTLIKDNLSGGERQMIIIARCLYQDYSVILFDESLSEIAHYLRLKIINNINYYYKDKTIIYVSHNLEKYPFNQIINLTARKEKNVKR